VSIRKLVVAIGIAIVLWPAPASAHEAPLTSSVSLDVGEGAVDGTIEVPRNFLAFAVKRSDSAAVGLDMATHAEPIRAYLAEHFALVGAGGMKWDARFGGLAVVTRHDVDYVEAAVTVTPPSGIVTGFTVQYDGIRELFKDHEIVVLAGPADGERRIAGVLGGGETSVELDERGRTAATFWTMVHHGFDHVGDGADHLLFLLVLLLPAPLVAVAGRWQAGASGWRTLRQILHVVTAFTLGHSVTLAASALDLITVPSRPVEILIAISVGVGAVHAIRPLIGHREALIAAIFGLVHGLAFAGILDDLGLSNSTAVGALFGFNIGIELAQLAAVALVFPSLYAASRTRWYPAVRIGGAGVALVAAAAWVADRTTLVSNPLQGIEDAAVDNPFAIAAGLALIAATAVWRERRAQAALADAQPTHQEPVPAAH
jgi:hypothetical protein